VVAEKFEHGSRRESRVRKRARKYGRAGGSGNWNLPLRAGKGRFTSKFAVGGCPGTTLIKKGRS
jgi:hypothetical protein